MLSTVLFLFFASPWSWAHNNCDLHKEAFEQLSHLVQNTNNEAPSNWMILQNQNFQISESCISSIGNDRAARLMQESMNQGLKCLKSLGTSTANKHHTNLLKVLSNRENPLKLRCDIDEETGKKTFSYATYAAATLMGKKDYPTVFMNPGMMQNGKFLHTDEQLKFIFFHEVMHTIDHDHGHNFDNYRSSKVDYAATCDVCCFGPVITVHIYSNISKEAQQNFCKICRGDFDNDRVAYFHAFAAGLTSDSSKQFVKTYVHKDMMSDLANSSPEEVNKKLWNLSGQPNFNDDLKTFLEIYPNKKAAVQDYVRLAVRDSSNDQSVRLANLQVIVGLSDSEICSQLKKASSSIAVSDYQILFSNLVSQKQMPSCLGDVMSADRLKSIAETEAAPAYKDLLYMLHRNSTLLVDNESDFFRRMLKVNPPNEYFLESSFQQLGSLIMTRPLSVQERKLVLDEFFTDRNKNPIQAASVAAGLLLQRNSTNLPDKDFMQIQETILKSVDLSQVMTQLEKSNMHSSKHKDALIELKKWNIPPKIRQQIDQRLSQPFSEGL